MGEDVSNDLYADPETTTLAEAWKVIEAHAEDGLHCLLCGQPVQIYWRPITCEMAASLIRFYRWDKEHYDEFVHLPTLLRRKQADETKLRFWDLIEPDLGVRDDGSTRTGYWRITDQGRQFVRGHSQLPRYARTFNNVLLGLSDYTRSGKLRQRVGIQDALGTRFDYYSLMAGEL